MALRSFAEKTLTSVKLWETWELIGMFFQKLSWCSTTVPNLMFLAYSYPGIWLARKNDPTQVYTDPKEPKLNRVKTNLIWDNSSRGNSCLNIVALLSLDTKYISTLMLIASSVLVQTVSSVTLISKLINQLVNQSTNRPCYILLLNPKITNLQ